jgi:hypothetical protein
MTYTKLALPCLALSLIFGCDPKDGGQPPDEAGDASTGGDDSGDDAGSGPSNDTSEGPGGAGCLESVTVLEPDAVAPLGFSAEAMLEGKVGTRKSELVFANEPTNLSSEIAGRVFPLEVTLAWAGGEVRWIESEPDPDWDWGGQLGGFPECLDRFEVDVEVHLVTEGGELDEHVETTLLARNIDRAELVGSPRITTGADLSLELQGSLDPNTLFDDPDVEVMGLFIGATWYEDLAGGSLLVEIRGGADHGDGGWIGFGNIASWGDEIPWYEGE